MFVSNSWPFLKDLFVICHHKLDALKPPLTLPLDLGPSTNSVYHPRPHEVQSVGILIF